MALCVDDALDRQLLGLLGEDVPPGHPDGLVLASDDLVADGDHGLAGAAVDGQDHAAREGLTDLAIQVLRLAGRDKVWIDVQAAHLDGRLADPLGGVPVLFVGEGIVDERVADTEASLQFFPRPCRDSNASFHSVCVFQIVPKFLPLQIRLVFQLQI